MAIRGQGGKEFAPWFDNEQGTTDVKAILALFVGRSVGDIFNALPPLLVTILMSMGATQKETEEMMLGLSTEVLRLFNETYLIPSTRQ